jgi:hypothetical protein
MTKQLTEQDVNAAENLEVATAICDACEAAVAAQILSEPDSHQAVERIGPTTLNVVFNDNGFEILFEILVRQKR